MGSIRFTLAAVVLFVGAIAGAPAVAGTVTVQAPAEDSLVYNREPDTNFGSIGTVTVHYYWEYSHVPMYRRVFCRWDLPTLPSGAIIRKAEAKFLVRNMSLWPYYDTPDVQCRRVLEPWQENTITWNNQPSRGYVESTTKIEWEKDWYIFNVTDMVVYWYANPQTNSGIGLNVEYDLVDPYVDVWATYYSREEAEESRRPKLVIEYSEVAVDPSSLGRVKAVYR